MTTSPIARSEPRIQEELQYAHKIEKERIELLSVSQESFQSLLRFLHTHQIKEVVFVGGMVRDILMGRPFRDIDFTTQLSLEAPTSLQESSISLSYQIHPQMEKQLQPLAEAMGYKVKDFIGDTTFEGVGFDLLGLYQVEDLEGTLYPDMFVDYEEQVFGMRPDLTINRIAMNIDGEVWPKENIEDLRNGIARFSEAPLGITLRQIVRAIKLVQQTHFRFDLETKRLIIDHLNHLALHLSQFNEKLADEDTQEVLIELLGEGILKNIDPEVIIRKLREFIQPFEIAEIKPVEFSGIKTFLEPAAFIGIAILAGSRRFIKYFPGTSRSGLFMMGGFTGFGSCLSTTFYDPHHDYFKAIVIKATTIVCTVIAAPCLVKPLKSWDISLSFSAAARVGTIQFVVAAILAKFTEEQKELKNAEAKIAFWQALPGGKEYLNQPQIQELTIIQKSAGLRDWMRENPEILSLKALYLVRTGLTEIPDEIAELSSLETLFIDEPELTLLPENISQLCNLKALHLRNSKVEKLPDSFTQITSLETLLLYRNQMKTLPEDIGKLRFLLGFLIEEDGIKEFPETFGSLSNLESLFVSCDYLEYLPESFVSLSSLKFCIINACLKELPSNFNNFPKLEDLSINGNELQMLPQFFLKNCCALKELDLSDNKISELNIDPKDLISLEYLGLNDNRFTSYPSFIEKIPSLKAVFMKSNPFSLSFLPHPLIRQEEDSFYGFDHPIVTQVNEGILYRGPQPSRLGIKHLHSLGIQSTINLRAGDINYDEIMIRSTNFPIMSYQFGVHAHQPDVEIIVQILKLIQEPKNQPCFIHCMAGVDRTGVVCAIYRIVIQDWSKEKAIQEMKNNGMHWWHENLIYYIQEFDVIKARNLL